ncbi:helix-turn-helix transcriptional regulator [Marinobacter zhanjiangensis]|uniref:HTH cro/C1-type domain-containing protein n=1 Tax=Marinobacter zhanjiangensis TaxID=578215 RepID=A0ABQ3BCT1_9GAMM|nr:helix-turn-helix transcriptional regulator [Marinobacter zhanjiangensis]GGY86192.1 hypothetical protein GCM10007071_37160 [Marinobacter zhanjiangensis]
MPKTVEAQTYNIRQVRDALRGTGELIEAVRKERGWSQSELGKRIGGIDRRHISALEKGDPSTDFGLVVSALWVLDIPVLETLRTRSGADASQMLPGLSMVAAGQIDSRVGEKRSGYGGNRKTVGRPRKKVIDNDF